MDRSSKKGQKKGPMGAGFHVKVTRGSGGTTRTSSRSMTPQEAARMMFAQANNNNNNDSTGVGGSVEISMGDLRNFSANKGIPCSAAEVQALMGMFAELMGMDGGPSTVSSSSGSGMRGGMFVSGSGGPFATSASSDGSSKKKKTKNNAGSSAPPFFPSGGPATWEAMRRAAEASKARSQKARDRDGGDSEDDDIDFDIEADYNRFFQEYEKKAAKTSSTSSSTPPVSQKKKGAPSVKKDPPKQAQPPKEDGTQKPMAAMEDDKAFEERMREEEEKALKASQKKKEKKARQKARQKELALEKQREAQAKKQEKAITSWRGRVVSACQANQVGKLNVLLEESPLKASTATTEDDEEALQEEANTGRRAHFEFLIPNAVPKSRDQVEEGSEARLILAGFVLKNDFALAFQPLRNGRTALHSACMHGDIGLCNLILDHLKDQGNSNDVDFSLEMKCSDSGLTPLAYAASFGFVEVVEALLAAGAQIGTWMDKSGTSKKSNGNPMSVIDLLNTIQISNGKVSDADITCEGSVIKEIENMASTLSKTQRQAYIRTLEKLSSRLNHVLLNGYSPPEDTRPLGSQQSQNDAKADIVDEPDSALKARKRKKKKKKNGTEAQQEEAHLEQESATSVSSAPTSNVSSGKDDPMVGALIGMGFSKDQILEAAKECGGLDRATPDDIITRILGGGESPASNETTENERDGSSTRDPSIGSHEARKQQDSAAKLRAEEERKAEARRLAHEELQKQQEAARRLAAKKEEQRRRNREWNNREQQRQAAQATSKIMANASSAQAQAPFPNTNPAVNLVAQAPLSALKPPPSESVNEFQPTKILKPPSRAQAKNASVPPQLSSRKPPLHSAAMPSTQEHIWSTPEDQPDDYSFNGSRPPSSIIAPAYGFSSFDDDKTVSSFGSSPSYSHSISNSYPSAPIPEAPVVPPPGFRSSGGNNVVPGYSMGPPPGTFTDPSANVMVQPDTIPENHFGATQPVQVPQPHHYASANMSNPPLSMPPLGSEFRPGAKPFVPNGFGVAAPSELPLPSSSVPPPQGQSTFGHMQSPGLAGLSGLNNSAGNNQPMVAHDPIPSLAPLSEDSTRAPSLPSNFLHDQHYSHGFAPSNAPQQQNGSSLLDSLISGGGNDTDPVGSSLWGAGDNLGQSLFGSSLPVAGATDNPFAGRSDESRSRWAFGNATSPSQTQSGGGHQESLW